MLSYIFVFAKSSFFGKLTKKDDHLPKRNHMGNVPDRSGFPIISSKFFRLPSFPPFTEEKVFCTIEKTILWKEWGVSWRKEPPFSAVRRVLS